MTTRVRWSSMPRVGRVQVEEDDDWMENGSEDTNGSLSADEDIDGEECIKRGPNHGSNVCAVESGRISLTVGGERFITISASCDVSVNLKAYLGGPYPTFSLVPVETKKFLWERFQQQYSWPKNKDNEVKKAWNTASSDRLRDIFSTARKKARENSRSENIIDWKGYGPPWLSVEHWNDILEKKWNNEGWKKKSKLGRDNRLTLKSGTITKHTAGSITIAAHKQRLHEKLGKPPTASQLFKRVHRRNKGEGDFVDNKSRLVWEKYDVAIHEKYGSNVSQPEIDIEAWCEASEGPCKGGRLYGLDIQQKSFHKDVTFSSSPNDGHDDFITLQEEFRSTCEKIDQLTRENDGLLQKMEDGRREEEKKRIEFEQTILRMLGERNG